MNALSTTSNTHDATPLDDDELHDLDRSIEAAADAPAATKKLDKSATVAVSRSGKVISLKKAANDAVDSASQFATVADRIRERTQRGVLLFIENGRDLICVKKQMPHGYFGPWLKREFGWSERTAQNYMNAAEAREALHAQGCADEAIALLPSTVLYDFDKLSDEEKEDWITALKSGDIADAIANAKVAKKAAKAADVGSSDKVSAAPSPAESAVADLAKEIASQLTTEFARTICKRPGFGAPGFGKVLQKEIARSFGEDSEEAA